MTDILASFKTNYSVLNPSPASEAPNGSVFIDSESGNVLSSKNLAGEVAPIGAGSGLSSISVFTMYLPAGASLAARIADPLAEIPQGWVLNTAAAENDLEFGTDPETLVITWDESLGTKWMYAATVLQHTAAPIEQGWGNLDLSAPTTIKTNATKTKSAIYLNGKGVTVTKDIRVFVNLL